ncbi:MAG: DUF3971 domain-containing protein [Alphaproteobacteria bacterium]|nr:DUF3971 domain-containing protein [Alphaproteobacteria bacterium]
MTRRALKLISKIALGLIAAVVVVVIAITWRLSSGPISLAFLTPYLQEALDDPKTGDRVEIADTVIAWDSARRELQLQARDVRDMRPDGTTRLRIEQIRVGLSRRAFFRGVIGIKSIAVDRASFQLYRAADGSFSLRRGAPTTSVAEPGADDSQAGAEADWSGTTGEYIDWILAEPDWDQPLAYLRSITFEESNLTITDEASGKTLSVPVSRLEFLRHAQGVDVDLDLQIATEVQVASLHGDVLYDKSTKKLDVEASFSDLMPSMLAAVVGMPELDPLVGVEVPLFGTILGRAGLDGKIEELIVDMTGRPGEVSYPGILPVPVPVAAFEAHGRFDGTVGSAAIKNLSLTLGRPGEEGPAIAIKADADNLRQDVPFVRAHGELQAVEIESLAKYWPPDAAAGARDWVLENIRAGSIDRATAELELKVPELRLGTAELTRLAADLSAILPTEGPEAQLQAKVAYAEATDHFDVVAKFADLDPSTMSAITSQVGDLKGARIPLTGEITASLDREGALMRLGVEVTGAAGTLNYPKTFPDAIDVAALKARGEYDAAAGSAKVDEISLSLGKQAGIGPTITIKATAKDLGAKGTISAQAEVGKLALNQLERYWPKGAAEGGREWVTENISAGSVDRVTAELTLRVPEGNVDKARIARIGGKIEFKDLEVHYMRPLAPVTGVTGSARYDSKTMTFKIVPGAKITDLTMTDAEVAITGLDKELQNMTLKAGLEGPMRTFLSLLNEPRLDLIGAIGLEPKDAVGSVHSALDLSFPLLAELTLNDADVRGRSRSKRLVLNKDAPNHAIEDMDVVLHYAGGGWREIRASGRTVIRDGQLQPPPAPQGASASAPGSFKVSFAPGPAGPYVLSAKAEDAGALLQALDFERGVAGGRLEVAGETKGRRPDDPLQAKVSVTNFRTGQGSMTARILAGTSLTGLQRLMLSEGLVIDSLSGELMLRDEVVSTELLRLKSASLGATIIGRYSFASDQYDLHGMMVPLDNVSGVLRNIPVIQGLFSRDGGLVAFDYRLTGPSKNPRVEVKTVTSLTPHVIRQLFGGDGGS